MKKKNIEKLNNMKVGEKLVTKKYTYEVCEGVCCEDFKDHCCFYGTNAPCISEITCPSEFTVDNKNHYFKRTKNINSEQVQEKDNLIKLIDLIEDNLNNELPKIKSLEIGIALEVIIDIWCNIDNKLTQRCKDIVNKILQGDE